MAEEMGFWDHAEALRGVLLRIAGLVVVLSCVLFSAMPYLFDNVILAPCHGDFILYRWLDRFSGAMPLPGSLDGDFEVNLINIHLASQFFTHVTASLWLAVVFALPDVYLHALGLYCSGAL